jgi:hypothetical protein
MLRRRVLAPAFFLLLLVSSSSAFAWPSPADWGCGWYGSVRPLHCNVGWGCGPRIASPAFCGPSWGWCGPRVYGVSSWSLGGLNYTYQGFGVPAWGWGGGWAAPLTPFPFVARQQPANVLLAARPTARGPGLVQAQTPPVGQPIDASSASQPAESIASIRARRRAEGETLVAKAASPVADELEGRADRALAAGKTSMARLYLQMAVEEADGPRRDALRNRLAALPRPDRANVAGEKPAVR